MTIVSYSTVADNNQALAPEGTMPVNQINDALRNVAAAVRGFGNDLAWYNYGSGNGPLAAERMSGASFRVSADLRSVYSIGRRVRAVGSATGDIQGTITGATFSSPYTTVIVSWDSGALATEAITVYVSVISSGTVSSFAGKPLVLSQDFGARLTSETTKIVIHSDGVRIGELSPDFIDLFSLSDDANPGPRLRLIRRSATPAAFDTLGSVDFYGRDTADSDALYGRVAARPITLTAGATSGLLDFWVSVAGTLTRLMRLRPSVLLLGKEFADSGATPGLELHADGTVVAGSVQAPTATFTAATVTTLTSTAGDITTVNATTVAATGGVTVDGVEVGAITELAPQNVAPVVAVNHGLGVKPRHVEAVLRCVTAEHDYVAGDDTSLLEVGSSSSVVVQTIWRSATQVGLVRPSGSVGDDFRVAHRTTRTVSVATPANWRIVFLVSK